MQITPEFQATATDRYGEFVVEPLQRGFGVTLGNPLRRILLSSIPGTAVTSVYVEDVLHEFSTIPGVREDVMQIVLNLKDLVVKLHDGEPVTLTLRAEKAGTVTAADLDVPSNAEIVNPELEIATLGDGAKLVMEVRVDPGVGYVPAELLHGHKDRINSIPVDAVFTPVRRVAYRVEDTRVGQKTDLDRLVVRVWTDGSVSPREALDEAVDILRTQLNVFGGNGEQPEEEVPVVTIPSAAGEPTPAEQDEPHISLESLALSNRVLHSLQEEGIDSVNALMALSERDLKRVSGIGDKSLDEIRDQLGQRGLSLKE
ncbi:MAG: DNA-directed RNA polymerase subunit alpha [Trueperaceae bacterium]|nr:DNA-directed RNA polymerase subunit alpha [Trueperaceae bacterium]